MIAVGMALGAVSTVLLGTYALRLEPDPRGQALREVRSGHRGALFALLMVVSVIGAATTAGTFEEKPAGVAFMLLAAASPSLVLIDLVLHRLPFLITGALVVVAVMSFGVDAALSGQTAALVRAGWAFGVVGALSLLWWRFFAGQVGLGDVALLAVVAGYLGWLSWAAVWAGVTLGFVLAAVAALVCRWRAGHGGGYLPLGPWLLGGCWGAVALAAAQIL